MSATVTVAQVIQCPYFPPRKSQRTWQPFVKYLVRNRGHQRASLKGIGFQTGGNPNLASTTQFL